MAVITSLVITLVFGRLIKFLQRKQVGESIRDLGWKVKSMKVETPTMGGVIILRVVL